MDFPGEITRENQSFLLFSNVYISKFALTILLLIFKVQSWFKEHFLSNMVYFCMILA